MSRIGIAIIFICMLIGCGTAAPVEESAEPNCGAGVDCEFSDVPDSMIPDDFDAAADGPEPEPAESVSEVEAEEVEARSEEVDVVSETEAEPVIEAIEVEATNGIVQLVIDRSAVPGELYYQAATVKIGLGELTEATASGEGLISQRIDDNALIVVTAGNLIDIEVSDATASLSVELVPIYDDLDAAWSHGYDDNKFFEEGFPDYLDLGVGAHVALMSEFVSDTDVRDWIYDFDDIQTYLPEGIGVTFHDKQCPTCGSDGRTDYDVIAAELQGEYDYLQSLVEEVNPNYKITVLTAPSNNKKFLFVMHEMQKQEGNYLLATEGQGTGIMWMDGELDQEYVFKEKQLEHIDPQNKVLGRGGLNNPEIAAELIANLESAISLADEGKHIWFNTFSHADTSALIVAAHVRENNLPVHIAGVDEIFAHWLIYKNATVSVNS